MINQSLTAVVPPPHVASAGLHVRRQGRGAPVLCLHAIAHDGRDFDDLAERLGGDFEIIAPDWPGQGLSAPAGPTNVTHYADLLATLIDELGVERPIIIGNSIGGAAAMRYAARDPSRVRGLVLSNAGGLIEIDDGLRSAICAMQRFFAAGARGAWWFPAAYRFYYRRLVLPRGQARARRDAIIAEGAAKAALLAEAWSSFAQPDNDLTAQAAHITCPTLFAWAKGDRIIPWSRSRAAALRFPHARVQLLRGGHSAFLEDPDRFERAFRAFAKEIAP